MTLSSCIFIRLTDYHLPGLAQTSHNLSVGKQSYQFMTLKSDYDVVLAVSSNQVLIVFRLVVVFFVFFTMIN